MGVDYGNELESQEIVKLRARDKAIKNAVKQAGVGLKTYSRSVNSELTDDEILTITSNTYELVGEVQYNRVAKQVTDQIILVMWEATVNVNVDDAEVKNWFSRESDERSTLISQTRATQALSAENDRKIEDLRKRANNVTDAAERSQLKSEFEQADNEFLSNQKVEEATRLAYQDKLDEAIKFYTEAIELKHDNAIAYNFRGFTYYGISRLKEDETAVKKSLELAIQDLDKAIQFKPDYSEAYGNRGFVHYGAKDYNSAIKDFDKAIELNPTYAQNYIYRSLYYRHLNDNNRALADLNKAIELQPSAHAYINRAGFYESVSKEYGRAIDDLNKAVELEPNNSYAYEARARFYGDTLKDYGRAAEDYSRAIELEKQDSMRAMHYYSRGGCYKELEIYDKAIADYTRAIELGKDNETVKILLAWIYYSRSECYTALGDKAKAQADMKKYKDLEEK